jgi:hypothetical protein
VNAGILSLFEETFPPMVMGIASERIAMEPRTILRAEGFAILAAALAAYVVVLDGPLWLLAVLALAPDLSMVGYLAGPRIGSYAYNSVHTYVLPLVLGGAGFWIDAPLMMQVAAVWIGHIGADRLFGYGLKYASGFKDTHLGSHQPAPEAVIEAE